MSLQSKELLAEWIARNQPHVFEELVRRSREQQRLHGITDFLKSAGTTFNNAIKSVGSFLTSPEGMATVGSIGAIYLQTRAQKDALNLQIKYAQSGQAPANIESVGPNPGSAVPVYVDANGNTYPLTPSVAQQLQPKTNWLPWALGIGAAGLFLLAMRR